MCRRGVKPWSQYRHPPVLKLVKKHHEHVLGMFPLCHCKKKEMRKDEYFFPCKVVIGTLLSRNVLLPKLMGKRTSQDKPVPSMPYFQREETPKEGCHYLEETVCALTLSVPFPALTSKLQSWNRGSQIQKMPVKNSGFGAGGNRS